jgi:hypothetical protein
LPDCFGWMPTTAGAPGALSMTDIIGVPVLPELPSWKCLECSDHGGGPLSPMISYEHEQFTGHKVEISFPSPGGSVSQLDESEAVSIRVGIEQLGEGLWLYWQSGEWSYSIAPEGHMFRFLASFSDGANSRFHSDFGLVPGGAYIAIRDLLALSGRPPASSLKGQAQRTDTLGGGQEAERAVLCAQCSRRPAAIVESSEGKRTRDLCVSCQARVDDLEADLKAIRERRVREAHP